MDRGKPGSKMHILSDANGLPLLVGISASNTHDSEGLKPMIEGHQTRHDPHNGRYFKPQRLHAEKAYDRADLHRWLRWKRIGVRIARKGIESSERLGRRRWVIERTMSWFSGYRRLSPRYERHPRHYLAGQGLLVLTGLPNASRWQAFASNSSTHLGRATVPVGARWRIARANQGAPSPHTSVSRMPAWAL